MYGLGIGAASSAFQCGFGAASILFYTPNAPAEWHRRRDAREAEEAAGTGLSWTAFSLKKVDAIADMDELVATAYSSSESLLLEE